MNKWKVLALASTLFLAACAGAYNTAGCLACTDGVTTVYVSPALTNKYATSNPDGLAFIWEHEMAHVALGHNRRENRGGPLELEADDWAAEALIAKERDPCNAVPVLYWMEVPDRAVRLGRRYNCENITDFSSN